MSLEALNIPRSEFRMTIPQRGISVVAPSDVAEVMAGARERKQSGVKLTPEERATLWSDETKARINMMTGCKILEQRYPTPNHGKKFMEQVDFERRDELLGYSLELTDTIVSSWQQINPDKPIAVLLFGSVAKGLVKKADNSDPSNIDMGVIGNITDTERESLLDAIRPKRQEIQRKILGTCPEVDSNEPNPGNAGVLVQSINKVIDSRYGVARGYYISSGAIPLYDPEGIWREIEEKALQTQAEKIRRQRKCGFKKLGVIFRR